MSTSWTVVVRGALMKGLVSTFLASIKVKISAMSTWKHYSFAIETEFVRDSPHTTTLLCSITAKAALEIFERLENCAKYARI